MNKLANPYINTTLVTVINLNPKQMNNKIYKNIKENLIKKIEGKCFKDFGFISKIYNIVEYKGGEIIAENPNASATFSVKFGCKLCNPLKGTAIIFKIDQIVNEMYLSAKNGPITTYIKLTSHENIYKDTKTNILMFSNNNKTSAIDVGKYIIVIIESKMFSNMGETIVTTGFIDRMATDEEINISFEHEYNKLSDDFSKMSINKNLITNNNVTDDIIEGELD